MAMVTMNTMMNNIVDIHAHIVFGVDDGAGSLTESKYLLDEAYKYGVKEIVCTPHYFYEDLRYDELEFNKNFKELNQYARELEITLFKGSENLLTNSLNDSFVANRITTINKTKYILVELKLHNKLSFADIVSYLEELKASGLLPIMAHPERINTFKEKPEYMVILKEMGIIMQLDGFSLFSKSRRTRKTARKMLKKGLVDVIASDVHNKTRNYALFYKSYQYVLKKYGREVVGILYKENPSKIVRGEHDE